MNRGFTVPTISFLIVLVLLGTGIVFYAIGQFSQGRESAGATEVESPAATVTFDKEQRN